MADTPPIKVTERILNIDTYKKLGIYVGIILVVVLLLVGGVSLWRFFFNPKDANVNKPTFVAMPFSKVEKDAVNQSNSQTTVQKDFPWEVDLFGGGVQYDNKNGVFFGGKVGRKF
jgi:hypothetical protein